MDQYPQDPLASGIGAMDTTPIPPTEIDPAFMTLASTSQGLFPPTSLIPQDSGMIFLSEQPLSDFQPVTTTTSIHSTMQVFMSTPMEAIDPPPMHPGVSGFMSGLGAMADPYSSLITPSEKVDLAAAVTRHSASPPQSQIPSPSIHGTSSSYGAGVTSSLDSALDNNVAGGRSRANTSLTPPSITSVFPPLTTEIDYQSSGLPSTSHLEDSVSQKQPHTLIGKMLKNIAITAIDAGDAFENCQGLEQTNKVGELRDRIIQVLDMLSSMSLDKDTSLPYDHSIPVVSGIVTDQATPIVPTAIPPMEHVPISEPVHLSVSESRKRCASELEEHRTVKALKREPQDDAPLITSIQDAAISAAAAAAAAAPFSAVPPAGTPFSVISPPLTVISQSRPSSRPPTPTNYAASNTFVPLKQPRATSYYALPPALPHSTSMPVPAPVAPPPFHHTWSDPGTANRHHHSLSAGAISISSTNAPTTIPSVPPTPFSSSAMFTNALPHPPHSVPSNGSPSTIGPAIGRMSRSGSINGTSTFRNSYSAFPYMAEPPYSEIAANTWHSNSKAASVNGNAPTSRASQSNWNTSSEKLVSSTSRKFSISGHSGPTAQNSPSDDEDDEEDSDSDDSISGKTVTQHPSEDRHPSTSMAADLPLEYYRDVERIFFEFLNKLCSKLDATDAKGEQIHQTLMAKKMQRLDESPDFRPFKFRIQAFTNAFMDELARQGYPEDKIPMKKARNYLWRQEYILRFNEDGKKAKSKGNHIWNVEAKKAGDGQWEFRPFHRKLAGTPPSVAYCGLRWSWKPHVWHPQCSFKKIPVSFSSPSLPPWLSWKNGELAGVPPPDAESYQITAVAKFTFDNEDDLLEHTFTITIAPASALDTPTYSRSRRPSVAGEQPPKRSTSDSALFQAPQRVHARINRVDDTRVIRVLQNIAQRVTDEAHSLPLPPKQDELQDLVKQKHVLEQTVEAYDKAISGLGHMDSRRLAVAAQHVVLQAAQTVMADRTVASGGVPIPQAETVAIQSVSVSELTDKTQDAIALAVKMNGTATNEVDIIVAATSILKSQTPMMETPPIAPPPSRTQAAVIVAPSRLASTFPPPTLSPLPEYI